MIKHIVVTQEDIYKGTHYPNDCPVTRAVERVCPGTEVYTYKTSIIMIDEIGVEHALTAPVEVGVFVEYFDNSRTVKPFEFDLNIPDSVVCDA